MQFNYINILIYSKKVVGAIATYLTILIQFDNGKRFADVNFNNFTFMS